MRERSKIDVAPIGPKLKERRALVRELEFGISRRLARVELRDHLAKEQAVTCPMNFASNLMNMERIPIQRSSLDHEVHIIFTPAAFDIQHPIELNTGWCHE